MAILSTNKTVVAARIRNEAGGLTVGLMAEK